MTLPRRVLPLLLIATMVGSCSSISSDDGWQQVAVGPKHSCGLRMSGEVDCWGCDGYAGEQSCRPQDGNYFSLSAKDGLNFALLDDGTLDYWGDGGGVVLDVPWEVRFNAIDGYCGITDVGTVDCWSPYELESSEEFEDVSGAYTYACGIRPSGEIECMGGEDHAPGTCSPPDGEFVSISVAGLHACAVAKSGEVHCWGCQMGSWNFGQCFAPNGQYSSVSVGDYTSCAIDLEGHANCWGLNDHGQADPPDNLYQSIEVGLHHSCGVLNDGRIECWGCDGWAGNDRDLSHQCSPP